MEEVAVVMYHVHIPSPDPMTNPSTLARAEFCGARSTPSYAIDGNMAVGGGGRDRAVSYYNKLNAQIEKRLEEPAEARLRLNAFYGKGTVNAKVTVDSVKGEYSELRLQIALVEEELTHSGQNNMRFHPMVVRSLGGEGHSGFAIDPTGRTTIEHSFDLARITEELKSHLEDFEKEREMTFTRKLHEMDEKRLFVAAFVQDTESRRILQSAHVRVTSGK